jgi:peptide-methionine (S)-S-oxide reductase
MKGLTMNVVAIGAVMAVALGAVLVRLPAHAQDTRVLPAPAVDMPAGPGGLQTVVLSGGCFWGVQGVFEHVKGVDKAVAGYAGGAQDTADYDSVSTGSTGHAESVQVTFDPKQISYGHVLQIFFSVVLDPTEVNHQGPDDGTQYRSEVFATSADQARVAKAYIAQLGVQKLFDKPIATRVDMLPAFYAAEGYHQDFLVRHPDYPYIVFNDMPKVAALKAAFPGDYRETPKTTGTKS